MRTLRILPRLIALMLLCSLTARGETVTWNLKAKYGITQVGIAHAIKDAKARFASAPNDTVILVFDSGTYELAATSDSAGIIEISGVKPGEKGRLIFRGAGMDKTTLVFDPTKNAINGRDVYRVSFIGMHMTRPKCAVSQGHVVQVSPGKVVLDIQPGFPTPKDIFNSDSGQGRYLRRYTDSRTDPQIIQENNEQIPWTSAELVGGRHWQINLRKATQVTPYSTGDLIAIKSKNGGQTYWLYGGSDIAFEDVKWTHASRGVFRGGFDKIRFSNCEIDRAPPINGQTPCLSTPGGGPQIGQPHDPPISGNIVENCRITGTGDDSVAFFNAGGVIRNCTIADSFARGILMVNCDPVLSSNTVIRCPVLKTGIKEKPSRADKP